MAVTDVLSLDEFVDLYKILEVPSTATEAELRERVNKLYLEAQRNLDHHNFRKRFYYQQLYEVHLPQAHQLLLIPARRGEYDRYLDAFHKGLPFPTDGPEAPGGPTVGELGRSDRLDAEMLPSTGASGATSTAEPPPSKPTKPPQKTTFNFQDDLPPTTIKPAAPATPARPAAPSNRPAAKPAKPSSGATAGGAKTAPGAPAKPGTPGWQQPQPMMDAGEIERRRDFKRRELIKRELMAAGTTWGAGSGVACFVVLAAIFLLVLNGMHALHNMPMLLGGLVAIGVVAALVGRFALREARRRIVVTLSKMPYDELLRRCAK